MKTLIIFFVVLISVFVCRGEETPADGSHMQLELGKSFEIFCTNSPNPELNITWFKDDKEILEEKGHYTLNHENNSLTVENARDSDAGEYNCSVQGSTNEFSTFTVNNRARVDIEIKGKSKTAVQGDELKLTCAYWGYPKPTVTWFKGDVELAKNDSRVILTLETAESGSKSVITIQEVEEGDGGEYSCKAGDDEATITVRVKDKLAALWPFLGIVAEVAVLCTIIFIYERRRSKQEQEDSDTDQAPETKNAGDNNVRQRK